MRVSKDAQAQLAAGFQSIATQYKLPARFPVEVESAAETAVQAKDASNQPVWTQLRSESESRFVTLDPATSTDLDQAFALEHDGDNVVLHYALADVGAFVSEGGTIEREAWERGVTIYGLAEKTPLYPKVISQGAASLLPDGPRPAVQVTVAIAPDGSLTLRGIDRIICNSQAKLAYDSFDVQSMPMLEEFANRMWIAETTRGAIRAEFPQQEVVVDSSAPGGVRLVLRAREYSELVNSALSLAVNMAIGSLLNESKIGLFRVMDDPEPRAIERLRRTAHALKIDWLPSESLRDLQRRMDPNNMTHLRFLLDARRAGGRAKYAIYNESKKPWHWAIGAVYAHATAPMRRLGDRYVLDLAYLLFNGLAIPQSLIDQMVQLPDVMARSEERATNVDRAVIDLLEAVSLQDRIGEILDAEVVDAASGIVQTADSAVRARAAKLLHVTNGQKVRVRIDTADPATRRVTLTALS